MTRTTTLSITLLAAVLSLAPGAARAQPDAHDPGALMDSGLAAYQSGDYDAAIAAFRAAYAADERPAALFAMAQAERKRGDCAAAVSDYDRFLATSPAERQADAARVQRKVCADQLATSGSGEPDHAPAPAAPPPVLPATSSSPPFATPPPPVASQHVDEDAGGPSWVRDPIADGLVGATALGAGLAVGLTIESSRLAREANDAHTYGLHASRADASARDKDIAIGAAAGTVAVAGAAAWRIVHDRGRAHEQLSLAPGPGVGLAIAGGF